MILEILVFILIFSAIILAHEGGHFWVARREGIKVEEFAFGFPPTLWKKQIGETKFLINAIPFGGYVRLLGEEQDSKDPRSFSQKSAWARLRVALAGIAMNLLLAWFLFTIWLWIAPLVSSEQFVAVASVNPNSPAEQAGLKTNDFIVGTTDNAFKSSEDLIKFTTSHKGEKVELVVKRNGDTLTVPVTLSGEDAPLGAKITQIGGKPAVAVPWWQAPWQALMQMVFYTLATFGFLGQAILGLVGLAPDVPADSVSGPIGIYTFLSQILQVGIAEVIFSAGLISMAVALFNILPIPAVDGGRAVFLAVEGVFGKRIISHQTEAIIHTAGFFILIALMLVVTFFDIKRL